MHEWPVSREGGDVSQRLPRLSFHSIYIAKRGSLWHMKHYGDSGGNPLSISF